MEVTVNYFPRFNEKTETRVSADSFDPALVKLNSVNMVINFCDSVYGNKNIAANDSGKYANLVSRVIRYRFQHGYTWYHFGHNYIAKLVGTHAQ